jgi:hypothetical protein
VGPAMMQNRFLAAVKLPLMRGGALQLNICNTGRGRGRGEGGGGGRDGRGGVMRLAWHAAVDEATGWVPDAPQPSSFEVVPPPGHKQLGAAWL